jgi:hypothetical protein
MKRTVVIVVGAAVAVLLSAGAAVAISDGNYRSEKQHCSPMADNYDRPDYVEPDCRNLIISVSDGNDNEWGHAGLRQTADGDFVDPTNPDIAQGPGGDPSSGVRVYFGADDNLDGGEHDSSPQINNGPSDGGAIQFNVIPGSVEPWLDALAAGDAPYLLTHPIPLVDAGTGACADGICFAASSQRRTAFDGGADKERDAANYEGKQWDPQTCAGPSDSKADCGRHPLSWWSRKEGTVYVEPGVQVYEDPDPQASPEAIGLIPGADLVFSEDPYPIPAFYAGTCGVVAGGGAVQAPASPVTNRAGQVVVDTCRP